MPGYDTNLAAEFYVLSVLHRLGADASLTLGNKKAVDIFVARDSGRAVTVDVKGVAGRFDWPADNIRIPGPRNHFYVFVSFEGRIADPEQQPSAWVVPSGHVADLIKEYSTRKVVSRKRMKNSGARYRNAWRLILGRRAS